MCLVCMRSPPTSAVGSSTSANRLFLDFIRAAVSCPSVVLDFLEAAQFKLKLGRMPYAPPNTDDLPTIPRYFGGNCFWPTIVLLPQGKGPFPEGLPSTIVSPEGPSTFCNMCAWCT